MRPDEDICVDEVKRHAARWRSLRSWSTAVGATPRIRAALVCVGAKSLPQANRSTPRGGRRRKCRIIRGRRLLQGSSARFSHRSPPRDRPPRRPAGRGRRVVGARSRGTLPGRARQVLVGAFQHEPGRPRVACRGLLSLLQDDRPQQRYAVGLAIPLRSDRHAQDIAEQVSHRS